MLKSRQSPVQIHSVLTSLADSRGLPVTWLLSDVRDRFVRDPSSKIWDAKNVIEFLVRRQISEGLSFDYNTDEDGRLSLLFTELSGGRAVFESAGGATCVLYDTTHGTNYYGCKLGLFTSK